MTSEKFSIGDAVAFGFEKFRKHWKFWLEVIAIALVIQIIGVLLSEAGRGKTGTDLIVYSSLNYLILIFSVIVGFGITKLSLDEVDGKELKLNRLLSSYKYFFNFFIATLVYLAIGLAGGFLLIVPGLIFMIKFGQYSFFIIDKKTGPIAALSGSGRITKGQLWRLLLFGAAITLLNLAGFFALGIGLLATYPTTIIAEAYVYRKLLKASLVKTDSVEAV